MDTKWKVLLVTLAFGFLGFTLQNNGPLGQAIWPPHEGGAGPTDAQLPLLILVGVIEATAFGLGFAFLFFGWSKVAKAPGVPPALATAAAVAITWGLVSWVPHTSMHVSNAPEDFGRLIVIEYAFHVTLVIGAAILATFAYRAATAAARAVPVAGAKAKPIQAAR